MYRKKVKPAKDEKLLHMDQKKKMPEKEVFDKKSKKDEGVFTETKDIKDGGLRTSLKVGKDHKFTVKELTPLLKVEPSKKFSFLGKDFTMTDRMKKQIQLAVNMMKK